MTFMDVFTQGVVAGFAEVIRIKGQAGLDLVKAKSALSELTPAGYAECLKDAKEALDCNMGEAMYRSIVNAACMDIAIKAYNAGMVAGITPCIGGCYTTEC